METILEGADINSNVLTLQDLAERRVEIPSRTLDLPYHNGDLTCEYTTLTTVIDPSFVDTSNIILAKTENIIIETQPCILIDNHNNPLNDFATDSSFVPLSEITNVRTLLPGNIEWFPERGQDETSKNMYKRKRKGDRNNWQRVKNKRHRMLGQEYLGFKKEDNKFIQNKIKPARKMGPVCMSKRCFGSVDKVMYCPKLNEDDQCCAHRAGNISDETYQRHIELKNMARAEKNKDKEEAQAGLIHALTADIQAVKMCPFLNASALSASSPYEVILPDFTFFKDFGLKDFQVYDSIRLGRGKRDNFVVDFTIIN
ncbi:hypothetical protein ACJJTC_000426 [Scirpophaga incertulas]